LKRIIYGAAVLAIALVAAPTALATKPASGGTTATGRVFVPNPVADLGVGTFAFRESLTDQKDADFAALAPAYHEETLSHLDGSGFLHGDYATVVSETGNPAYSANRTFDYNRHQDEFEQVMAYYWVTEAQKYLQNLGFGTTFRAIDNQPQRVRINQLGADNSFETDHPVLELRFGKGGVDDAEDAEVILHEYGHAIHTSQNFNFASEEAGAISEGFGDYWALTVSDVVSHADGVLVSSDLPCIADWDATSYTSRVPHCLRRTDLDLHYPADLNGEVHHDGQIWSRALWDIRQSLGNRVADTIILTGSFDFPGTTMTALAQQTVLAAGQLYNASTAKMVKAAFHARGIL
jgi:zinc metalloprotease ZmpB